jgi:hypothetical protein
VSAKGFKEWEVVCGAMATGRQSVIFRKGGIHEGREGFSFAEREFFLFPTRFHHQAELVREGRVGEQPEWRVGDEVTIELFCEALWAKTLRDWDRVAALEPEHILTEGVLRERFDWEGKGMAAGGIHVALVRVFRLAAPWTFPYEKKFGGCRSWIDLPEPPEGWRGGLTPVVAEREFRETAERIERVAEARR